MLASALLPWLVFLGFNLYSEHYSPDRELMKGSVVFFQATLGSLTALLGIVGYLVGARIKGLRSNPALNTDAVHSRRAG